MRYWFKVQSELRRVLVMKQSCIHARWTCLVCHVKSCFVLSPLGLNGSGPAKPTYFVSGRKFQKSGSTEAKTHLPSCLVMSKPNLLNLTWIVVMCLLVLSPKNVDQAHHTTYNFMSVSSSVFACPCSVFILLFGWLFYLIKQAKIYVWWMTFSLAEEMIFKTKNEKIISRIFYVMLLNNEVSFQI